MGARKQHPEVQPLTEDEIAAQEGEHLPDREVMSTIRWPMFPEDPEPYAPMPQTEPNNAIEPPPPTDA